MRRLSLVGLCLLFGGCAGSLEYGVPPLPERLGRLQPGASTRGDVLLALGEPRGRGAMVPAADLPRHDVWVYEHTTLEGKTIRVRMLLVLFRDDVYEGHLAFEDRGEKR